MITRQFCIRRWLVVATGLLCIWASSDGLAAVNARLSADFIDELESVRLVIRATGSRKTETLDLSALEHDFQVMGTNYSSQYQYINGREQSWVDYQITLQPKRTGTLVIPRIVVGNETTNPLQLIVQPIDAELREKINELVFFETEISATESYVQAQIVVTRRLLYSTGVQLYSEIPGPPDIPDAVVLVLGDTKSTQTMRGEKRYGMVEQRYAIFPETSGELMIPGISITASVRIIDNGRVTRKGVRVGTDDLVAAIKPVPQAYPRDKPWLPAEAVTIEQSWSPDIASPVDVGDTLERRIDVRVHGNTGSIAPPLALDFATQEFRQYPQAPSIDDDTRGQSVVGLRTEWGSVVPQMPGTLTVPGETVAWWDTLSDELRITELPSVTITAIGAAIQNPQITETTDDAPILQFVDELAENLPSANSTAVPVLAMDWRWGLIALTSLVVIVGLIRSRRRIGARLSIIGRKIKQPTNRSSARNMLKALRTQNVSNAKAAVVAFLQLHPEQQDSHYADVLISELNRHLYHHAGSVTATLSEAERKELLTTATHLLASAQAESDTNDLPPLYAR